MQLTNAMYSFLQELFFSHWVFGWSF